MLGWAATVSRAFFCRLVGWLQMQDEGKMPFISVFGLSGPARDERR